MKEVRLIDANALEPDTEWDERYDGFLSYSQAQIDAAPTIETAPKWIPCSERLPEQSGIYFVCFTFDDGTHAADISYINVSRGLGHITHWMPLELPAPDPPESDRT